MRRHLGTVLALSLCLALFAVTALAVTARADVAPPRRWISLVVQSVSAPRGDVPAEDRHRAVEQVGAVMRGFLGRIERCIRDQDSSWRFGPPDVRGRVRARLVYSRAELPTRTTVLQSSLGRAARSCVAEVLPSVPVRPAVRGDVTIEAVIAPRVVSRY